MRREFERRSYTLEQRIDALASEAMPNAVSQPDTQTSARPAPTTEQPPPTAPDTRTAASGDAREEEAQRRRDARRTRRKSGPSLLDRSDLKVATWLANLAIPFASPAAALMEVLNRYRAEGKLPALLMALAGGIALVLGSGFLVQYSFNNLFSELARVGAVGAIGVCITGIGAWISLQRDAMAEYGASVIAIGLSIAYLAVWFAGPAYGLVDTVDQTVGVTLVTGAAYGLALRFETRITASLTVIGGAFAPFVMSGGAPDPTAYTVLLSLLALAGVHLALSINWRGLVTATFAATTLPLDWVMSSNASAPLAGLAAAHVLFYLFTWALMFDGLRVRTTATRGELSVLVANLALFAGLTYWLPTNPLVTFTVLAANVIPFGLIAASRLARGSTLAPVFLLTAGVLALVALFSLLSAQWLAISVAIEGALLIHLGLRLNYRSLRLNGVALLAGALIGAGWHTTLWALGGANGWNASLASMPGALVLLGTGAWLYARHDVTGREALLRKGLLEAAGCVFALTILLMDRAFLASYALVLAPIPMYLLLWWAARHKLRVTECVAFAHFALFAIEVAMGISAAGTSRFTAQPLLAQIARVELFGSLWVWSWFYTRHYADGLLLPVTRGMREVFFLALPVGLLPTLSRHFPEWFPIILWVSVCATWEIQRRVALRFIRQEHLLLAAIAACLAFYSAFAQYNGDLVYGYAAVLAGLAYFMALFVRGKGLSENFEAGIEPLFVASAWYLGACTFAVGFFVSGVAGGLAATVVCFAALLARQPLLRPLRGRLRVALWPLMVCTMLAPVVSLLGYRAGVTQMALVAVGAAAATWVAYSRSSQLVAARLRLNRPVLDIWLHMSVAFAYLSLLAGFGLETGGVGSTVLLTVHATAVLFVTLRPRFARLLRMSVSLFGLAAAKIVFWDMSDFSVVEKIVAFMVLGALLLGAAYAYQTQRNRQFRTPAAASLNQ